MTCPCVSASSSFASRRAVCSSERSSGSGLPPGKQISPACALREAVLCVRRHVHCASHKRGTSTAEGTLFVRFGSAGQSFLWNRFSTGRRRLIWDMKESGKNERVKMERDNL